MRSALILWHEERVGLAGLRAPLVSRGYAIDQVMLGDPGFPGDDLLSPDVVIILGGTMAVYEQVAYPGMGEEIVRLCERIAANRPTFGICLGAQMMAAAMGSRVYKGPHPDVYFAPVELTPEGRQSPLAAVADIPVMHWHGDTFDLPEAATRLARSASYANQAFSCGPNILAVQFHPEMGDADDGLEDWCAQSSAYLTLAGTDAATLLAEKRRDGKGAADAGRHMIDQWLAGLDDANS